jgi:hypothetical protein
MAQPPPSLGAERHAAMPNTDVFSAFHGLMFPLRAKPRRQRGDRTQGSAFTQESGLKEIQSSAAALE